MLKALGALAVAEAGRSVRKTVIVYVLYAAALLVGLMACGFAIAALHTFLAIRYDAVVASLVIAGGLLVLAVVLFAIAAFIQSRRKPPSQFTSTALAAAPLAATALQAKPSVKAAAVGGLLLLGAMLARQLGR
jgi:hypothetical protein